MNNWINTIFTGFLTDEMLAKINNDYDSYKNIPLTQLGLDSLATMGIVLKMESDFNKKIDYESFDIATIETLDNIEDFLNS